MQISDFHCSVFPLYCLFIVPNMKIHVNGLTSKKVYFIGEERVGESV